MKQICSKFFVSALILLCMVQTSEGCNRKAKKATNASFSKEESSRVVKRFLEMSCTKGLILSQAIMVLKSCVDIKDNDLLLKVGNKIKENRRLSNALRKGTQRDSLKIVRDFYATYKQLDESASSTTSKDAPAHAKPLTSTKAQESIYEEQEESKQEYVPDCWEELADN